MNLDRDQLKLDLIRDEACRRHPYDDANGQPIKSGVTVKGKITGGIGRNMEDVPFSDDEINLFYNNDVDGKLAEMDRWLPWWRDLDEVRTRALVNLAFNVGVVENNGQLASWHETLGMMQRGEWAQVAAHLRTLPWFRQVGIRAERVVHMFETGSNP